MLVCAALVLLMTPGLALFYGGLGRRKNVSNNIMASFCIIGVEVVMWALFGFSLAFGADHSGVIGGLDFLGLSGVGVDASSYAPTIPFLAYALFQMMFAIITPALARALVNPVGALMTAATGVVMMVLAWSLGAMRVDVVDQADGQLVALEASDAGTERCCRGIRFCHRQDRGAQPRPGRRQCGADDRRWGRVSQKKGRVSSHDQYSGVQTRFAFGLINHIQKVRPSTLRNNGQSA